MLAEALVLIEDDLPAQKMIVTWPVVGPLHFETEEERQERWAAIALVDIEDLSLRVPVLFDNAILGPEGSVDPLAKAWIRTRIRGQIPKHLLDMMPKEGGD